ncbi:MAG: hypothetical protein P8X90_05880 [Desulfobacterales bacterium]
MNKPPAVFLFVSGSGAELTWLYAWASFVLFSFFQRLYPLPEALGTFILAAFLTLYRRRRSRRMIQIIGLHLIGLVCTGLWVVHVFFYRSASFWNFNWLTDFFNRPRDHFEWFLLIFVLGYTVMFWASGVRFALQERSYFYACTRFDRGVAAFFCLFLIKLLLHAQMGVQIQYSITVWLIFPFFIFSLTEIGLTRNQGHDLQKAYLSGYHAVGVFAGFSIGALILGAAVFLLFLPYLKSASMVGYHLIKSAAAPLAPILIAVIKFIFGHANFAPQDSGLSPSAGSAGQPPAETPGAWMLLIQKILLWGGGLLLLVLGIAVGCLTLWYLMRWLFIKRCGADEKREQVNLLRWWIRLKTLLLACYEWLLRTGTKRSALDFFAALRRWGRYSGIPQAFNETPMEYGVRLASRFPQLKSDILLIIEMLQWEVYGESTLSSKQILSIQKAWQTLHSPLRWPFRFKSIFSGG